MTHALQVNGKSYTVDVEDDTPLLWVLRDVVSLKGAKFGCGIGLCGACTVLVDGIAARSCTLPVSDAAGVEITTIEGLAENGTPHPVQQAWIDAQVPQCGYCQTGFIMATVAMLDEIPEPSDAEIDAHITNICRCGTYPRIRQAIHLAAGKKGEKNRT